MRLHLAGACAVSGFTLLVTSLLAPAAEAVVRRVNVEGTADYPTIQAAIDASAPGDTVLVAPGRYSWTNQGTGDGFGLIRYWLSEADEVALVSEGGPEVTLLDAEFRGRVFFANGNNIASNPVDFVIDGFTFQNGNAPRTQNREEREGGGMAIHLVEPVFKNCIFFNNRAEYGGGVWAGGLSSIRFEDCKFIANRAQTLEPDVNVFGGGVCVLNSSLYTVFERCTFDGNTTQYRGGGAFVFNANIDFIDCVFTNNSSLDPNLGNGTAIYLFDTHTVNLDRVFVRDNDTQYGPAVLVRRLNSTDMQVGIHNTVIADNVPGKGIVVDDASVDITCTNIYGHPLGNWLGSLEPKLGQNGNVSIDPKFCSETEHLRWVHSTSPMLAANNSCGVDIGGVFGGCATVPVAVSSFGARWFGDQARLELDASGVDDTRLVLVRHDDDGLAYDVDVTWAKDGNLLFTFDPGVPGSGATYRLLIDGEQIAETQLAARPSVATRARILSISPNPSNPHTTIEWSVPDDGPATLRVFDLRGRLVNRLVDQEVRGGVHRTVWRGVDGSGREVVSGVYLVEVVQGGRSERQKLALVR